MNSIENPNVTLRDSLGNEVASTAGSPSSTDRGLIVKNMPFFLLKSTYAAASGAFTPGLAPTDIFTITGSATKLVKIIRIAFTMTQTTSSSRDVLLIKRSTANTGGTSTTLPVVPMDSTNLAATAVARSYTANPTALGTVVGSIRGRKVFVAATSANSDEFICEFGMKVDSQPIILRGAAETLAFNLGGVTSAGGSVQCNIDWTEE